MKRRIPTLNEFVQQVGYEFQDKRKTMLPVPRQTTTETIIVLEFPVGAGNKNFANLQDALNKSFSEDGNVRIEQNMLDTMEQTRATIYLKDVVNANTKLDNAIKSLDFIPKVIKTENF